MQVFFLIFFCFLFLCFVYLQQLFGLWTIYKKEMKRTVRVLSQTIIAPVISTSLYFIVFGAALGATVDTIEGVSYAAYIVPGLIMMALCINGLSASSSGFFFPKWSGTIYEMLSAPLSYLEICLGYVLAATTRAFMIGFIILAVSMLFVSISVEHVLFSLLFAFLTTLSFALLGFIIALISKSFDQLALAPNFIITPLSFLGGVFYSIDILPPFWQTVSLFNPFVYMINGLRYGFYGISDVSPFVCLLVVAGFTLLNLMVVLWIFRTGYRLRP